MAEEMFEAELVEVSDSNMLNGMLAITFAVAVAFLILASTIGEVLKNDNSASTPPLMPGDPVEIVFSEPIYMPRHEECIDENNGQDPD